MTRVAVFLEAVWNFVVGEDWRTAIGVAVALGSTALLAEAGSSAWWMMPVAVFGLLALSVRRAARSASRRSWAQLPTTSSDHASHADSK
jgi:hypothetical protein